MLLQLAFDLNTADEILSIAPRVAEYVDIIEIGTPALLRYGERLVAKVRAAAPGAVILADAKIADAGRLESEMMFEAGADIVTVLGVMNEETIRSAAQCAKERGKEIMCDLIGMTDYVSAAAKLNPINPGYVCSHVAADISSSGAAQRQFAALKAAGLKAKLALAGGVTYDSLGDMAKLGPEIVIVGRGITEAADACEMARKFKEALNEIK